MPYQLDPLAARPATDRREGRRTPQQQPAQLLLLLLLTPWIAGCARPRPEGATTPTAAPAVPASPSAAPNRTEPEPAPPDAERRSAQTESRLDPLPDRAPSGEARIRLEAVAGGFEQPLLVLDAGDGRSRLYVAERAGTLRAFDPTEAFEAPRLVLDLRDSVETDHPEQGLLGLAFHPDFAVNGRLFASYTTLGGDARVTELRFDPAGERVDPASERELLRIPQPAGNHNTSHLAFGPDGMLYVGVGDGGGANDRYGNGQNPASLLGKILRIDVDRTDAGLPYAIPADNPYRGASGRAQETWAWGLRHPWRFSFDRLTGALFIGEVGQAAWEEVDWLEGPAVHDGANFGWPIFEADDCLASPADCGSPRAREMRLPILSYDHSDGNCSIVGGFVYRPDDRRDPLAGSYLFGDYCSGRIWGARQTAEGVWTRRELADTDLSISSFGEDSAGQLYLSDLAGGTIYRIVSEP